MWSFSLWIILAIVLTVCLLISNLILSIPINKSEKKDNTRDTFTAVITDLNSGQTETTTGRVINQSK